MPRREVPLVGWFGKPAGGASPGTQEAPHGILGQGVRPSSSACPCLAAWVNGPPPPASARSCPLWFEPVVFLVAKWDPAVGPQELTSSHLWVRDTE